MKLIENFNVARKIDSKNKIILQVYLLSLLIFFVRI